MRLWIKICGNTSLEDARLAADAGADAVGFVFAPSPRRVTLEQAATIVAGLPAVVEKIGVFVDAGLDEIVKATEACGLTGVQLHFAAMPALPGMLRARLGTAVRILRVVHSEVGAVAEMAAVAGDVNVDAVLVDSRTATAAGGTGMAFDWAASTALFRDARDRKIVAAGGLTPGNVAGAIKTLRPWGVDAVSGVESEPGCKDPVKVREFVARARETERE
jgi:phosphoribosylanthranilate isomerase